MLCYLSGQFLPEESASISVRDQGFTHGDAVFEVWRTYGSRPSARTVRKHLDRLAASVRYMELPAEALIGEIERAAAELLERCEAEVEEIGDVRVIAIVSRGVVDDDGWDSQSGPTRCITFSPIPWSRLGARLYDDGAALVSSLVVRSPFMPGYDPRVKSVSRFGFWRAELKRERSGPGTWTVLYDNDGNITEAAGANICVIRDGRLVHPPRQRILGGISLSTFCELAEGLGIPVEQDVITLYDLLQADEVWLTGTSFAAAPIREIDGIPLPRRTDLGSRILRAWTEFVDYDFVEQGRRAGGAPASIANTV